MCLPKVHYSSLRCCIYNQVREGVLIGLGVLGQVGLDLLAVNRLIHRFWSMYALDEREAGCPSLHGGHSRLSNVAMIE